MNLEALRSDMNKMLMIQTKNIAEYRAFVYNPCICAINIMSNFTNND